MCEERVVIGYRDIGGVEEPVSVQCGDLMPCGFGGVRAVLCPACEESARREYPQGWIVSPGDLCAHGRYHDPAGHDCACPYCEE